MRRVSHRVFLVAVGLAVMLLAGAVFSQDVTVSDGWIQLPPEGASTARAFVQVKNPTMYDIYLVSADSDVAGKVEFRRATEDEAQTLPEITVPAYGSVSMGPAGVHLELLDLKRALSEDENISLTLTTDGSLKLEVQAVVRTE